MGTRTMIPDECYSIGKVKCFANQSQTFNASNSCADSTGFQNKDSCHVTALPTSTGYDKYTTHTSPDNYYIRVTDTATGSSTTHDYVSGYCVTWSGSQSVMWT